MEYLITHPGPHPDLLTSEQVAREVGLSDRQVRRLAAKHGWGRRFGKVLAFTLDDLQRFHERRTTPGRIGQ